MTKWARMRKRKERKRAEEALRRSEAEGIEVKLAEPENISENIQHPQEIEKIEDTKTSSPNTILSQIPRYVYLLAFFVLLSGVFVPLITYQTSFDIVIEDFMYIGKYALQFLWNDEHYTGIFPFEVLKNLE